ncbi:hypothetical protein [Falsirhodobacter xinxiangensis]|uniref:hypothetical protein n=1 Tax=Falsirhodobacter xinxiangensis TaxID=2530049 RepID=UPI0010AA02DE|nr:hypothetical protein [Rhodobacter xinxiangensis]
MHINPAIVRVILRYLAGALVSYGVVSAGAADTLSNDPVVIEAATAVAGLILGAATEWYYARAKRTGDARKL